MLEEHVLASVALRSQPNAEGFTTIQRALSRLCLASSAALSSSTRITTTRSTASQWSASEPPSSISSAAKDGECFLVTFCLALEASHRGIS